MTDDPPIWESLFAGGSPESGWIRLQWALLQKRSRPLLLLPRSVRGSTQGLSLYPAQRGAARLAKKAIPYMVRAPFLARLPRVTLQARADADLLVLISRLTGVAASQNLTPAILCGNHLPDRQRVALMAFNNACEPAAIIKAAAAREARELVLGEAALLARIPASIPGVVRLRAHLNLPYLAAMGLAYCPGGVPINADKLPDMLQAWIHPGTPSEVRAFGIWSKVAEAVGRSSLFKALDSCLSRRQVHSVIQHGDFTPANIRVAPSGTWTAIDWESGSWEGLPAWDWFHFVCQKAILVRRLPVGEIADELENLFLSEAFLRYASATGIHEIVRPWLLAYLLHQNYVVWPSEGFDASVHLLELLAARWGFPGTNESPVARAAIPTVGCAVPHHARPGADDPESAARRRLRVLISAYACDPQWGAEAETGWQWAMQMARYHDVTVLTRRIHQSAIERGLLHLNGSPRPEFLYHEAQPVTWIEDWFSAARVYYVLWQRSARRLVAQWVRESRFDLLHHATIGTYRFPTAIWGHGLPCVWGPVGGAESVPARLLPWGHPRPLAYEVARNIDNFLQASTLGVMLQRARQSTALLVATPRTESVFRELGCKPLLVPAIGVHAGPAQSLRRVRTQEPLRLLYLGRFSAERGIDLMLEALAASNTRAELTLVGEGPFLSEIEKLIPRLNLASRVKVLHRQPLSPGHLMYSSHDVFIFPSLHGGSSHRVVEAMTHAMPVICLAVGGVSLAVSPDCGIQVPLGSRREVVAGLAQAIRTFDLDRQNLIRLGQKAQEVAAMRFGWEARGKMMDQIYRQAAGIHDATG